MSDGWKELVVAGIEGDLQFFLLPQDHSKQELDRLHKYDQIDFDSVYDVQRPDDSVSEGCSVFAISSGVQHRNGKPEILSAVSGFFRYEGNEYGLDSGLLMRVNEDAACCPRE